MFIPQNRRCARAYLKTTALKSRGSHLAEVLLFLLLLVFDLLPLRRRKAIWDVDHLER